jgi:hypothetical protein
MPLDITLHRTSFSLKGEPFIPLIGERGNTVLIPLPARLEDEMKWRAERALAQEALKNGQFIFWEFDFGWSDERVFLSDQASFLSFTLAIEHFVKTLWIEFENVTLGVALYRGNLSALKGPGWEEEFSLEDSDGSLLSSTAFFARYLQKLASYLPDAVLPFALFDASSLKSQAQVAQLLSKERFPHLHLAVKGASLPLGGLTWEEGDSITWGAGESSALGVVFPRDSYCSPSVLERLDLIFSTLSSPFRVVYEPFLTEHWDGLDQLLVLSEAVSPQGKRMLQGFCAAGGEVLYETGLLAFS